MQLFLSKFVDAWPHHTTPELVALLGVFREMRAAMNVDEINEHVTVYPDPCRMLDGRQKLDEFKRALMGLVLHEWKQPPPGENTWPSPR